MRQQVLGALIVLCLSAAGLAAAGDIQVDGRFVSTAASGTAPIAVASDTLVPNLNADLLDGLHASAFALEGHDHAGVAHLVRTVVVSPVPGDVIASGALLVAALADIVDAGASNRWLIQLEPGDYFVPAPLSMKPYVSIVGAGSSSTRIFGTPSSRTGVVALAENAELADVEVAALYSSGSTTAISCEVGGTSVSDVLASAASTVAETIGLYAGPGCDVQTHELRVMIDSESMAAYGVYVDGSSPELSGLEVSVVTSGDNAYGVAVVGGGSPVLRDTTIEASSATCFGVFVDATATVALRHVEVRGMGTTWGFGLSVTAGEGPRTVEVTSSRLVGSNYAVAANDGDLTLRFGGSELDGALVGTGTTTYQCAASWDGSFDTLDAGCL